MLRRYIWVVVVLVSLATVPAFGQGTTASIIGRVTDQTGAVHPWCNCDGHRSRIAGAAGGRHDE